MRRTPGQERVLATVLFTDIVGSTELAASLGDRRWRDLVARHHAVVRAQLKRFRGREVDTAGDGFFAIFDRPAQAIECASAILAALRPLGIEVRAGLHTGEVEQTGKAVGGIAVHIGARVMANAGPGEIVVTSTVKDLVTGSGIEFVDRGPATLRGVEGEWRLHSVATKLVQEAEVPETPVTRQAARWSRSSVVLGLIGIGALGVAASALLLPRVLAGPVVPGIDTVGRIPAGGRAFDLAVEVGQRPSGLARGEGAIWVINVADQTVSRIDPASGKVDANPAVGGTPSGVTYGAGGIWVTTHFGLAAGEDGSVVPFDNRAIRGRPIPVSSGVEAIAFGAGFIWVADRIHDVVRKIDPSTNRLAPEAIPVGRAPGAIAIGAGSVWVTSTLDNTLWRIDPVTYAVEDRIALPGSPTAIAVVDAAVWITSETADGVTRVDPATNTLATIPGLDGPRGVTVTEDGVWVAVAREGSLARIDPATNLVVEKHPVDGVPEEVLIDENGGIWVSVRAP